MDESLNSDTIQQNQPAKIERGIMESMTTGDSSSAVKFRSSKGVVIFLDALGTRGVWARGNPLEYIESWEKLLMEWEDLRGKLLQKTNWANVTSKIQAFSDTIITTVTLIHENQFTPVIESDKLLFNGAQLVSPMILSGIMKGIYLKGVISIGQFFQSDTAIIGPAVDEAADWYKSTNWIGVSTAPTAHFTIEKLSELNQNDDIKNWYLNYSVPGRNNTNDEKTWAVNWPRLYSTYPKDTGMSPRALIFNKFAEKPISGEAAAKFHNTIRFYDHAIGKQENNSQE